MRGLIFTQYNETTMVHGHQPYYTSLHVQHYFITSYNP